MSTVIAGVGGTPYDAVASINCVDYIIDSLTTADSSHASTCALNWATVSPMELRCSPSLLTCSSQFCSWDSNKAVRVSTCLAVPWAAPICSIHSFSACWRFALSTASSSCSCRYCSCACSADCSPAACDWDAATSLATRNCCISLRNVAISV